MTTARTSYPTLLRLPGAAAFFAAACTGRLGAAMTSLGLVWLLHDATGSYAAAGSVAGTFALAEALVGPQVARLVDAHGQTRLVPVLVAVHAAAVAVLIAGVLARGSTGAAAAAAVVAGASIPQLGALSATRWVDLLRRHRCDGAPSALPAAFALESVANASAYLVGPVLVSAVAAAGDPAVGSAAAAALVLAGGLALAAQRGSAPPPAVAPGGPRRPGSRRGPRGRRGGGRRGLVSPAFVVLVAVNLGTGAWFGALQVSVPAFTVQVDRARAAPVLSGVGSVTGLLAAWAYGSRTWRAPPRRQLALATLVLAGCGLSLLLAGGVVRLGLSLAVAGAVVPVVLVLSSVLAQAHVGRGVLTQAFAWLGSASAAGSAGAAALAGIAVDAVGARGGLAVAAVAAAAVAAVAVSAPRALGGPPPPAAGAGLTAVACSPPRAAARPRPPRGGRWAGRPPRRAGRR